MELSRIDHKAQPVAISIDINTQESKRKELANRCMRAATCCLLCGMGFGFSGAFAEDRVIWPLFGLGIGFIAVAAVFYRAAPIRD